MLDMSVSSTLCQRCPKFRLVRGTRSRMHCQPERADSVPKAGLHMLRC